MQNRNQNRILKIGATALFAATSFVLPSLAQEAGTTTSSAPSSNGTPPEQSSSSTVGTAPNPQSDQLLVTVNGTEIRQSHLRDAISALPPQMQQMPQEMLIGLAIDQLVARQLILEEARSQNLQHDPEVQRLVDSMVDRLTEQAVVQVWLQRELEAQVSDENLQQAFAGYQAANPDSDVTLDEVRPQLVQALRQEAMTSLTDQLRSGAEVVFYDANGNPTAASDARGTGGSAEGASIGGDSGNEARSPSGTGNGPAETQQ